MLSGRENALHPIGSPSLSKLRSRAPDPHRNKNAAGKVKFAEPYQDVSGYALPQERKAMDMTTLLIIVIIVLLLGGGGFYGRGRWW